LTKAELLQNDFPKDIPDTIDIGSPGSVTLVIQAILPYLIFMGHRHSEEGLNGQLKPLTITIHGGTNVSKSPSVDYFEHVFLPTAKRIGLPEITVDSCQRGWRNGKLGSVTLSVTPVQKGKKIPVWVLDDAEDVTKFNIRIVASKNFKQPIHNEAVAWLNNQYPGTTHEVHWDDSGDDERLYLLMIAETTSGHLIAHDCLWDRKATAKNEKGAYATAKQVVEAAGKELRKELATGSCVDSHMRDQLVIYQALSEEWGSHVNAGSSKKTQHAETAWWLVKEMLDYAES
jgi:RNA 3'-terminal phosphate cyclase (ATP)